LEIEAALSALPEVRLRFDAVPPDLRPNTFFATVINRVLSNTPVEHHGEARFRRNGEYQRLTYPD
jgi:hypothetical protein